MSFKFHISIFALTILLFSPKPHLMGKQSKEKITITPIKTISYEDALSISNRAGRILLHIAQARLEIANNEVNKALDQVTQAQSLIENLKLGLPTARVTYQLKAAKKHLNYETSEEVMADLVPVMALLDELEEFIPIDKPKSHVNKARGHLKKGKKKEAGEELAKAEISLVYTEIEVPIQSTKRHIEKAAIFLERNNLKGADFELAMAENGVQFVSVGLFSPLHSVKGSLNRSIENYKNGNISEAKINLKRAEAYMNKVTKLTESEFKERSLKLSKDIAQTERTLGKPRSSGEEKLNNLLERANILVNEWMVSLN